MKLELNKPIEVPGDRYLVTTSGPKPGLVAIHHAEPRGRLPRQVAQLQVGESQEINVPPGFVSYDATNAMGNALDVDVSIEEVPKASPAPTLEQRVRAVEAKVDKQARDSTLGRSAA